MRLLLLLAALAALALPSQAQVVVDGQLTDASYRLLATDDGGPALGFGPNNQLNAVYAYADPATSTLYLGIAGQVEQNGNAVVVFLDTRPGGYATGDYGRNGAPGAVATFNSGHDFDTGFLPDYALNINCNSGGAFNCFFNLYTLSGTTADGTSGGPDNYLGDANGATTRAVLPAAGDENSRTVGFELALTYSPDGTGANVALVGSSAAAFALIQSPTGFLSNQFLTPTNDGDGNYGNDPVDFRTKTADPVALAWQTLAGRAGWRHLGWPVAGGTVGSLASQNLVQGVAGSYPDAGANVILARASDWVYATSTANPLLEGSGIFWYHYDIAAGAPPEYRPLPYTLYAGGTARVDNVTYSSVGDADRFHLVGNPFETPFDAATLQTSSPGGVATTAFVYDPNAGTAGDYRIVDATSMTLADRLVPTLQGLLVQVAQVPAGLSGGDTFTFPVAGKARTEATFAGRGGSVDNRRLLAFELDRVTAAGTIVEDVTARLMWIDGATTATDRFDASEPVQPGDVDAGIAFHVGDDLLAQRSEAYALDGGLSTALALRVAGLPDGETYRLRWPVLDNVPAEWSLRLIDTVTGAVVDLRTASEYGFSADAGDWTDRFQVDVTALTVAGEGSPAADLLGPLAPNPVSASARARLDVSRAQQVRADLYDALGRRVATVFSGTVPPAGADLGLDASRLAPGAYVLHVVGETFHATRRLTVAR